MLAGGHQPPVLQLPGLPRHAGRGPGHLHLDARGQRRPWPHLAAIPFAFHWCGALRQRLLGHPHHTDRQPEGDLDRAYYASTDGGATWRPVSSRRVDAISVGWTVMGMVGPHDLRVYDPTTGDQAVTRIDSYSPSFTLGNMPEGTGICQLWCANPPYVAVSQDGGSTWDARTLPPGVVETHGVLVLRQPTGLCGRPTSAGPGLRDLGLDRRRHLYVRSPSPGDLSQSRPGSAPRRPFPHL